MRRILRRIRVDKRASAERIGRRLYGRRFYSGVLNHDFNSPNDFSVLRVGDTILVHDYEGNSVEAVVTKVRINQGTVFIDWHADYDSWEDGVLKPVRRVDR